MPEYRIDYLIDGYPCHYMAEGDPAVPVDRCLLAEDEDLTAGQLWQEGGFTATRAWLPDISQQVSTIVNDLIAKAVMTTCQKHFTIPLEKYHTLLTDEEHTAVMQWLKKLPFIAKDFFPLHVLDEGMSHILGQSVSCYSPYLQRHGCSIRLIRPKSKDYNPLHRDGWLDRLRHAVNVYLPIAGSNPLSSLSLIPGSHRWNESETERTVNGCLVNGIAFTVPTVISSVHPLKMVRPPLKDGEILIFSPYIIHGGAYNFNKDITRISLEMRFWKKS